LEGLEEIGFVEGDMWRSGTPGVTVDTIKAIIMSKEAVVQAALRYQAAHWQAVVVASDEFILQERSLQEQCMAFGGSSGACI
jgi:hypothetical protein